MNEDTFNMELRKFLKRVGITSQREIEKAVHDGIISGALQGTEKLDAKIVLRVDKLGLSCDIQGIIALE
jgi:16S rRNA U516 pseudouridylate synthase RsuA-like enzyme